MVAVFVVCEWCYLVERNELRRVGGCRKLGGGSFRCHAEEIGGEGEDNKFDERVELQWIWRLMGWRQRNALVLKLDQEKKFISLDLS